MNRPPGVGTYRPVRWSPRSISKRWLRGAILQYSAGSWQLPFSDLAGPSGRGATPRRVRGSRHCGAGGPSQTGPRRRLAGTRVADGMRASMDRVSALRASQSGCTPSAFFVEAMRLPVQRLSFGRAACRDKCRPPRPRPDPHITPAPFLAPQCALAPRRKRPDRIAGLLHIDEPAPD